MNASPPTGVLPSLEIRQAGSQPNIDPAVADRHAAETTRLPHAKTLLDSQELSALLGREVIITHVRIKAGHSVVVSHRDADTTSGDAPALRPVPSPRPRETTPDADESAARQAPPSSGGRQPKPLPRSLPETGWGWTSVSDDADKFAKALKHADQMGEPLAVHETSGPFLASGTLWTDRVLAKELRTVHAMLGEQAQWEILRYNPRRRVVAAVSRTAEDGQTTQHVVRVSSEDLSGMVEAAERWRHLGAPLTKMRTLGTRGTSTMTPLWGSGDLVSHPHAPAAHTAGTVIAEVHSRGRELAESPEAAAPSPSLHRLTADPLIPAEAVACIAPWLAERAYHLAESLQKRLHTQTDETELHGDLSPDQVLVAAPESHKIRIIDLDRTGRGPAMRDVGSWLAACRQATMPDLSEAFLAGYTAVERVDRTAVHAWEAYAHLTAALDDFRHREQHWPAGLSRRIELAELAVRR